MLSDRKVGLLGGGQLGRMLIEAGNRLNLDISVLDVGHGSAKKISNHNRHLNGSFKDRESIQKLARRCDVITVEIEHVDTHVLEEISTVTDVQPNWKTIRIIQDKYQQKLHLASNDVATAKSIPIQTNDVDDLQRAGKELGFPFMLKARMDAYDGKGNFPVNSPDDLKAAIETLGDHALYAEKWAEFRMELAVMVVKTKDDVYAYPVVETVHQDSICKLVYAPARGVSESIIDQAQQLAKKAIACFPGKGIFGVEMFLLKDDTLLINEIAPRPHNSGHYTIEACPMSQYEAHLRAILDLPISSQSLRLREPAIMLNILGGSEADSHISIAKLALSVPNTQIHLYDKGEARPGRKMGHVTITSPSMEECEKSLTPLVQAVDEQRSQRLGISSPTTTSSTSKNISRSSSSTQSPKVAVIMGSHSDLPVLKPGIDLLTNLGIPFTTRITSAHRTPNHMSNFVSSLSDVHPDISVVIAAAGGAAHLPGMAASHTLLPVIGVPVKPTVGDGWDSLVSMSNMPKGVPVATVGVNNAINGALLACRILAVEDAKIRKKLEEWVKNNEEESLRRDRELAEKGVDGIWNEWFPVK